MTEAEKTEYYFMCLLMFDNPEYQIALDFLGIRPDEKIFKARKENLLSFLSTLCINEEGTKVATSLYGKELEKLEIEREAWIEWSSKHENQDHSSSRHQN